ncbi:LacI family DNA-binding transcriptional regulator [Brevibacillus gelatini]|uniref:LacI family transcriptional regulator n=1 Tax=Brevibacillus gelatini TaxID=1655277 RepID=A0A3M8B6V3_9BACL|nr:substrate-binding domain-containing protein [Brevibacillus gelatini]RNB59012.1 LacI family transcriptional regulator [Brevibacillus gelatini]
MAQLANVSIATVSRVLNNSKPVRPELRERVLRIVEETGFQPNAIARSLVSKETRIIGVMIPDINNNFYSNLTYGIDSVLSNDDYSMFLAISDEVVDKELKYLRLFKEKQLDGVIIASIHFLESNFQTLHEMQVPMVVTGHDLPGYQIPTVNVNNVQASYDATAYLISQGHRKIACVSGPLWDPPCGLDRMGGYRKAMRAHDLPIHDGFVVEGDFTAKSGYEAMRRIWEEDVRPTAVFVATDLMAVGVLNYLHDHGIRVPEDISVMGFDNLELASLTRPMLTTVHNDPFMYGKAAAEQLLKQIRNEPVERMSIVPHHLVIRQSVSAINEETSRSAHR